MWDEITYPFPNFNGCTVEVWEWISNFTQHFTPQAITYPCWDSKSTRHEGPEPCKISCAHNSFPSRLIYLKFGTEHSSVDVHMCTSTLLCSCRIHYIASHKCYKQRVLMHGHQGWNVRHGLCHICMIYVYVWVVYSFCLFCCLFIIVTTQFVALYKPCKPKPKPSTYDPPDNHPLAEIQRQILRPEPKQQICHQHANTDHFGK